jgi:hypothetical protein
MPSLKVSAAMPTSVPARSAKCSRGNLPEAKSAGSGIEPSTSAAKVYWRIAQVKRKNANTNTAISASTFSSNTSIDVRCAKGISRTNSAALSVVPSRASRPPMMISVADAKNAGLADRLWTMMPSSTRGSRAVACSIQ